MAKKFHKITKGGNIIYPATISDAVVHPEMQTSINKLFNEINVSVIYPTGGTGGSNKYDLATAIVQVPEELRVPGMCVSFLNEAGTVEKWEYQGDSWEAGDFIQVGPERFAVLNNELGLTNKSISLIIGDIENIEYTESECINENVALNNKGELITVKGVKVSGFKSIQNAIYLSYNIQHKGGHYVIAFYSGESDASFLGQYSSTDLPNAGVDTDITKHIPEGAKYIRFTTYDNWILRIKVIVSNSQSSGLLGNLSELKTQTKESIVPAFNELYDKNEEYNDKNKNTLSGGDYNYNYTSEDCVFVNKGLNFNDGTEKTENKVNLSDFLSIEGFTSISWNILGKNALYLISFYRNKTTKSFIKSFSSTSLSQTNTDEDITKFVPKEARFIRFTNYVGFLSTSVKVTGSTNGVIGKVEALQEDIDAIKGNGKIKISRGINFIGHSIWANNNTQDNFADNQILKGYQTRILDKFDFANGWRQHIVSGASLRTLNFLENVAQLEAKENDIWTLDTFVNEGHNKNGVGTYEDFLEHDMVSDITTMTYMGALGRFAKIVEEKSGTGAIVIASDNLFDPYTAGNKLRHDNLAALIEVCKRQGWYYCPQMVLGGFNEYNYKFLTKNGGYSEGKYPVDAAVYVGDGVHPNNVGYSLAVRPWLQILEEISFRDSQPAEYLR